jgi:predicted DNA-binding transcriptional regulator AlpA
MLFRSLLATSRRKRLFLSVEDLAARWGVKPTVVYKLRYSHQAPPAIRVGRELRWNLRDVESWEQARRDGGGPTRVV